MEAQVSSHFDDRDARVKAARTMTRLRVTNPRCENLQLGENNRVTRGTAEILVWDREVPGIMAMVERDAVREAAAESAFEMELVVEVAEKLKLSGDPEEILAAIKADKNPEWTAAYDKAKRLTAASVESHFHRLAGRDRKPLTACEVLAEKLPSPYHEAQITHDKMIAHLMQQAAQAAVTNAAKK